MIASLKTHELEVSLFFNTYPRSLRRKKYIFGQENGRGSYQRRSIAKHSIFQER
jgi:hypothetical protein